MAHKTFITLFLFIIFFASVSSCSNNNDDSTEQSAAEHDWMLEGSWKLDYKFDGVKSDMPDISFCSDGTGISGSKRFRWNTLDNMLFMRFDDGSRLQEYYSINGATLTINNTGCYNKESALVGAWYSCDAMSKFDGKTFCYFLDKNGDGIKYEFDYRGLALKTFFKWNKWQEGISFSYRYDTLNKVCSLSNDTLTIDGEGQFTSTLPFYGHWTAVDCEKGLIHAGDDNYSELDICSKGDADRFVCNYKTISGDSYKDSSFQGTVKFITSYQQVYNDQQLFMIKDLSGSSDAAVIGYRFFYYPQRNKVYLDLSSDFKTGTFVRYELK